MRVKFRNPDLSECPPGVTPYARDPNLTPEQEYEVHAVTVFEGVVLVLVIDDLGHPGWKPTWLFEATDCSIPQDWICNTFLDWPELLIGPNFIACSREAYTSMVELEANQVARLRKRIATLPDLTRTNRG